MQLDLLWKYMQVDMEADRFENAMRQAPNRQKLLKNRNFIMEQQTNMKNIEAELVDKSDRMEAIEAESARLSELVKAQVAAFQGGAPTDLNEVDKQLQSVHKLLDSLNLYEQELAKMQRDADELDKQQKEIRVKAAKSKAEYDQLKEVYDEEFKRDSEELTRLRANAEKETKPINKELLDRYNAIKQHAAPPMAQMVGDQCGGCYMSQPAVVLREIKAGEKIVCCDNCGRILYVPQE